MKHGVFRSIGHNLADSLASGCCLLIGIYDLDISTEIARARGLVWVDFRTGAILSSNPSPSLIEAIRRYHLVLPELCVNQGTTIEAFRHLSARFWDDGIEARFSVTVEDERKRRSTTHYGGNPGRRIKINDRLGRLRPKPIAA